VLVAAQRQHRVNVERTGLEFLPVENPPDHAWRPLMARLPHFDIAEANARMVGEYFARIDDNAAAVSRAGAGIALDAELDTRHVVDLSATDTLGLLGAAVERVLDDPSYRREARRIVDATRALPPVDAAVDAFAAISDQRVPGPVLQH
jgi:hypothetical protein